MFEVSPGNKAFGFTNRFESQQPVISSNAFVLLSQDRSLDKRMFNSHNQRGYPHGIYCFRLSSLFCLSVVSTARYTGDTHCLLGSPRYHARFKHFLWNISVYFQFNVRKFVPILGNLVIYRCKIRARPGQGLGKDRAKSNVEARSGKVRPSSGPRANLYSR